MFRIFFFLSATLLIFSCQNQQEKPVSRSATKAQEVSTMRFHLTSPAFAHGERIPVKYTCDGADVSPPLNWTQPPAETRSLVLICDDPDAPMGTWVHWVLYGIPAEQTDLPENLPREKIVLERIRQGKNSWGRIGYGGPCPPRGKPHRYFFKLYAVDVASDWEPGLSKEEVLSRLEGHILAQAELMGTYQR